MRDILHKFSNHGKLVLDRFAGALSTLKACLLLYRQRRMVGCDKNISCLQKSMPRLVKVYANQLLNNRSVLIGDSELKDSVREYLAEVKTKRLRE